MGLLTSQFSRPEALQRSASDDFWYNPIRKAAASGVNVNEQTAMMYSAVWAATTILTEPLAMLTRNFYQHRADGKGKDLARSHNLYRLFHGNPNPEMTGFAFFSMQQPFLLNWGNCYAEISRNPGGGVAALWPIHPSRIPRTNIVRDEDSGELVYKVKNDRGRPDTLIPARNMLHIPGKFSADGVTGQGVVPYATESIGMGIATERFGASLFGNEGTPTITLHHPGRLGPEAEQNLRRTWSKRMSGNQRGLLILEEGINIERLTIPPEQAQFLQTRQFNITEIARWYNVPVHMLREMSKSSFNNIESENLQFVIISLMPWIKRWEEELARQLLTPTEQSTHFFKFMLQSLLRGDMAARAQFYKEMWFIGVFSINDILELEDRNPIGPAGDVRFVQSAMVPIDQLINGQPEEQNEAMAALNARIDSLGGATSEAWRQCEAGLRQELTQSLGGLGADLSETITTSVHGLTQRVEKISETDSLSQRFDEFGAVLLKNVRDIGEQHSDAAAKLAQAQSLVTTAARESLKAACGRMVRKHAQGARQASRKPENYLAWNDGYADKVRELFTDELSQAVPLCEAAGVALDVAGVVDDHLTAAREELLDVSDGDREGFEQRVEECVSAWESTRAQSITDSVFQGESNGSSEAA